MPLKPNLQRSSLFWCNFFNKNNVEWSVEYTCIINYMYDCIRLDEIHEILTLVLFQASLRRLAHSLCLKLDLPNILIDNTKRNVTYQGFFKRKWVGYVALLTIMRSSTEQMPLVRAAIFIDKEKNIFLSTGTFVRYRYNLLRSQRVQNIFPDHDRSIVLPASWTAAGHRDSMIHHPWFFMFLVVFVDYCS